MVRALDSPGPDPEPPVDSDPDLDGDFWGDDDAGSEGGLSRGARDPKGPSWLGSQKYCCWEAVAFVAAVASAEGADAFAVTAGLCACS